MIMSDLIILKSLSCFLSIISGNKDKLQTLTYPAGNRDKLQTLIHPAGNRDKLHTLTHPAGNRDKLHTLTHPAGNRDKLHTLTHPAGNRDKLQTLPRSRIKGLTCTRRTRRWRLPERSQCQSSSDTHQEAGRPTASGIL